MPLRVSIRGLQGGQFIADGQFICILIYVLKGAEAIYLVSLQTLPPIMIIHIGGHILLLLSSQPYIARPIHVAREVERP